MFLPSVIIKNLSAFLQMFFVFISFAAQSQNIDHPTIKQLEVSYKEPDLAFADTLKMVRSQSVITLKSDSGIVAIHFKIRKESNQAVIYQVDNLMNASVIKNEEGIILFKKEGNTIYINSSSLMPLDIYQYQLITENLQGILSESFIETH